MSDIKSDHEEIVKSKMVQHEAIARRVPEQFSIGSDKHNASKAWLDGYDTATAQQADNMAAIAEHHEAYARELNATKAQLAQQAETIETKQFTQEEMRSLYNFLEKQYLPYDDLFLHETVRKLGKLVNPAQK